MSRTPTLKARQCLLMDRAWRFHLGDVPPPPLQGHNATYHAAKAGAARGAAAPALDDSQWRELDLPHDWQVEAPFDQTANVDHGYKPRCVAWYRRKFLLDEADRGKHLAIRFDGVATHCTVWLNGQVLHRNWCGYTPFVIDITDMASCGPRPNTLAVRVDADPFEGWWYEGAGVYRHVWLVKTSHVHVTPWGVFANPLQVSEALWQTRVETTLTNTGGESKCVELVSTIMDPDGAPVGDQRSWKTLRPGEPASVHQMIAAERPRLWSLDERNLYTLKTEALVDGRLADDAATTFGYRTIEFDADRGFYLNGKPVKLKGTCNHQDHAGVGAAVPDSIQGFRVRRLREMGSNAYRCSHNPPAPELLDACDRLGMLVMDENRNYGSAPEHLDQLRTMVLRDRNHPCVIFWSIFNEEPLQGTETGRRMAETMRRTIRELDASRPVTAAMNGGIMDEGGVADAVDVMGINYSQPTYDTFRARHPRKPIVSSENNCAYSTRGVYETSKETFYFDSYDTQKANWGETARRTWREIDTRPFVMGGFIWTGFDYRGEPSPYEWPCINSHWGIMDTCGFAKDSFYLHRAMWTEQPMVHILPHWNWTAPRTVKVVCCANCESVELFLNGRSLGAKPVDPYDQVEWDVDYAPGQLRALGYRNGRPVAEGQAETTGEAVGLGLESYRHGIRADGEDAVPMTVFAVDARGRRVPTASHGVRFAITGPGRIIGVGNGDPTCHEPDKGASRSLFNGLCQVIVQSVGDPGAIRLTASTPGVRPCSIVIEARECVRRPFVPPFIEPPSP